MRRVGSVRRLGDDCTRDVKMQRHVKVFAPLGVIAYDAQTVQQFWRGDDQASDCAAFFQLEWRRAVIRRQVNIGDFVSSTKARAWR